MAFYFDVLISRWLVSPTSSAQGINTIPTIPLLLHKLIKPYMCLSHCLSVFLGYPVCVRIFFVVTLKNQCPASDLLIGKQFLQGKQLIMLKCFGQPCHRHCYPGVGVGVRSFRLQQRHEIVTAIR